MDSLLLKSRAIEGKSAVLAVVCDGVGSLVDGGFASAMAVQMLSDWFDKVGTAQRIGLMVRDMVLDINRQIVYEAEKNNKDTASTLSALLMVDNDYYVVHVGDSRVYCLADNVLTALTGDDLSPTGKLTAYIGKRDDIFPQYSEGSAEGKVFLVCSDGLHNRMDLDFLASRIKNLNKRSMKEALEDLTQYVITRGEQDNITIALVAKK